jgi:hypothetical protein
MERDEFCPKHFRWETYMQRVGFAVAMSVSLTIMGSANLASAQEPCCHHHHHHPVLRAAAVAVRVTVHVALAPLKLLAHHHHHGCDDCGYGYEDGVDYGPGGLPHGAEPIDPGLPPAEAVYAPIVAPELIAGLSDEECRAAAAQAISRGVSLYRQGEVAVAREYFHEAAVLTPDVAATWGLCGVAAAAANDQQIAAVCANHVRAITANNAAERSNLSRTLAPIQGNSRVAFELLVRNTDVRLPTESLVNAQ